MKVAVIGGGPSGLAIAFGLVQRGIDVTVLEKESVGGRVRTSQVGAYRVEHGPAGILSDAPATTTLLKELGDDAPRVVSASARMTKRYVVKDGRPRALPTGPTSLLGGALGLRDLWSLWRERGNATRSPNGETVAAFVRRRFGEQLATAFAQPIVVGVFGGDYEALEVASAFPALLELEREHGSVIRGFMAQARARKERGEPRPRLVTFAGGMGALPAAIARKVNVRIADVSALERAHDQWLVRGPELTVDHVVLAIPAEQVAQLVPALELQRIPSTPMASVSLAYRAPDIGHPLDGFGLLCPRGEGKATLGVVFMSRLFEDEPQAPNGEVLLRVLMGGPNDPALLDGDDATILDRAHREVASLLDIVGTPTFSHLIRWPRAIPQYVVGHAAMRARVVARAAAQQLTIAGTSLSGIGVNDVLREAAVISARLGT